jgi:hypothetical protein
VYATGDLHRFLDAWRRSGAPGAAAPPLWGVGAELVPYLEDLPGPPFELRHAFERGAEGGLEVARAELGPTRTLTEPGDLVRQNFVYLEEEHDERDI